jgi:hypothetical protein
MNLGGSCHAAFKLISQRTEIEAFRREYAGTEATLLAEKDLSHRLATKQLMSCWIL